MSRRKADDYIEVELELDELDMASAESKATYAEIQDYVLKEHGLKVSNLYISQVKRKFGIEVGENLEFVLFLIISCYDGEIWAIGYARYT